MWSFLLLHPLNFVHDFQRGGGERERGEADQNSVQLLFSPKSSDFPKIRNTNQIGARPHVAWANEVVQLVLAIPLSTESRQAFFPRIASGTENWKLHRAARGCCAIADYSSLTQTTGLEHFGGCEQEEKKKKRKEKAREKSRHELGREGKYCKH